MAACADRVARDYADLVAGGATAAKLCQTDRYYALAVAFKATLLAALVPLALAMPSSRRRGAVGSDPEATRVRMILTRATGRSDGAPNRLTAS
jgi:hypothetical protein